MKGLNQLLIIGIATLVGLATLALLLGGHKTRLTVTVSINGLMSAPSKVYSLRCNPPAGTVPNPRTLCKLLATHRDEMLFPAPSNEVCGGTVDVVVRVRGTYRGRIVDATLSECSYFAGEYLWTQAIPGSRDIPAGSQFGT